MTAEAKPSIFSLAPERELSSKERFHNNLQFVYFPKGRERWAMRQFEKGFLSLEDVNNPWRIVTLSEREDVAHHEASHAIVAEALGGTVIEETVKPQGRTLGYVKYLLSSTSQEAALLDRITIAMASMAGEDLMGIHDHRGCGSDLAQATYFAHLYTLYFRRGNVSSLLSMGYNRARGIINENRVAQRSNLINRKSLGH